MISSETLLEEGYYRIKMNFKGGKRMFPCGTMAYFNGFAALHNSLKNISICPAFRNVTLDLFVDPHL